MWRALGLGGSRLGIPVLALLAPLRLWFTPPKLERLCTQLLEHENPAMLYPQVADIRCRAVAADQITGTAVRRAHGAIVIWSGLWCSGMVLGNRQTKWDSPQGGSDGLVRSLGDHNRFAVPLGDRSRSAREAHGLCRDSALIPHFIRTVAILDRTR